MQAELVSFRIICSDIFLISNLTKLLTNNHNHTNLRDRGSLIRRLISLVDQGFAVITFHQELRFRNGLLRWIPCNILVLNQLFAVSLWSSLLGITPPTERSTECI